MGSTRLPNLSLNGNFLYYKNIFNNKKSFWFYYYFFFFFNSVFTSVFNDGIIIKFSKHLFYNNFFRISNYQKNFFILGLLNLYKVQNWLIINLFLYNSNNLKFKILTNNSHSFLNLKLILKKKKSMNYKILIK